jgi:hypothetical protein
LFAGISAFWGSGGRFGLDTVGGEIERRALAGDRSIIALVWATVALKLAGAALALALVRPWGRRLPRRRVVLTAGVCAACLIAYGAVLEAGNTLVVIGIVRPEAVDWRALRWHWWLWDLSFLIWGILLAAALRGFRRSTS